jgi:hypothetical protein
MRLISVFEIDFPDPTTSLMRNTNESRNQFLVCRLLSGWQEFFLTYQIGFVWKSEIGMDYRGWSRVYSRRVWLVLDRSAPNKILYQSSTPLSMGPVRHPDSDV